MKLQRVSSRLRSGAAQDLVWLALRWAAVAAALLALRMLAPQAAGLVPGLLHTLAYSALAIAFGASLLPGHTPLITRLARRLNPHFHTGMQRYTRRVTWAWCLLALGELATSAALLAWAPRGTWLGFVAVGHLLPVILLFAGEYALRKHLFGHEATDFATMLRAFRKR